MTKIISVFNNKGGVGKTTLSFHLAYALQEMGKKVLMIDLDPQCNLSIMAMKEEVLESIWEEETPFVETNSDGGGFEDARKSIAEEEFINFHKRNRTIHYLLKPTEEGTGEPEGFPLPVRIQEGLDLIPGRLTLYLYEYKISERWPSMYIGDPLAIRTITKIRNISTQYAEEYGYDFVIIDTSPSLGALNKTIISTVDGFLVPCLPDAFSMYGIRNIGNSLSTWKKEFTTLYELISEKKRHNFPADFVRFLGYTIYNAKKYDKGDGWNLSTAHKNFAEKIPGEIIKYIPDECRSHLTPENLQKPIGNTSIMHTHNTLVNMAQKYHIPIWLVPSQELEDTDKITISGNKGDYSEKKDKYHEFANDLLFRISSLG